jgi:hypothetical protein
VAAATAGTASEVAREYGIELEDNRVRVVVECTPAMIDSVRKKAEALGMVETSHDSLLQVIVPIDALPELAKEPGVLLVRLPLSPLPQEAE